MDTIPGGAYRTPGGWVNADGAALTAAQIAEAEQLHAAQQQTREGANLAFLEAQARNDPLARSLAHALRPQAPPDEPPARPKARG